MESRSLPTEVMTAEMDSRREFSADSREGLAASRRELSFSCWARSRLTSLVMALAVDLARRSAGWEARA